MPKKRLAELGAYDPKTRSVPVVASTPRPTPGVAEDGTPIREALLSWDLTTRFASNPVILFAHDSNSLPIGVARDIEQTPDGLTMRIYFASEAANPLAEQIAHCVEEGVLRAVSVGFEPGPGTERIDVDGTKVIDRTDNVLLEVSFVPIGADEDAGTPDLNPAAARVDATVEDATRAVEALAAFVKTLPKKEVPPGDVNESEEDLKRRISAAASVMSKYRARIAKKLREEQAESAAAGPVEEKTDATHFDVGRLDAVDLSKFPKTQTGGPIIPARLSRIGVLKYLQPDGTYRRELRLPEEVFKGDSMRTLEHANVVDIEHHRSMLDTDTFDSAKLGHVGTVRREGQYIVGDLRIESARAIEDIEQEERRDVSCGYRCRLDFTPGVFEGEPYDCIQRDITYNHVALCPPNRGRAGPDVALRLDTGESLNTGVARIDDAQEGDTHMTMNAATNIIKVRLDGIEVVEHSPEHFALVQKASDKFRSDAAEASTKLAEETKRADKAEGDRDALKTQLDQFKADADEEQTKSEKLAEEKAEAEKGYVRARRALERATMRFFGEEEDEDGEKSEKSKKELPKGEEKSEDEEKTDSVLTDDRLDAMSDRDLMLFGIRKVDPKFSENGPDGKPRSDDYIRARFDGAIEHVKSTRTIHGVTRGLDLARRGEAAARHDAADDDDTARKKRDEKLANLWKAPSSK